MGRRGSTETLRTGIPGIYRDSGRSAWVAEFRHNGKRHYVGRFDTIGEAVKARTEFAFALLGEYPADGAGKGKPKNSDDGGYEMPLDKFVDAWKRQVVD